MFTEVFYKLSKCVCEFWAECSLSFYLLVCKMAELTLTQHMHGYIYPAQQVCSKDPKDGPKDHLSDTMLSKDKQGPRRIVFRGLSFEAYLSMRSKDPNYPSISTSSFDQNISQHTICCPSQTGGWLTWSTYNTNQDIVT
ncbi:hypothetical protein HanRHA438_Chr09g0401811 [Helianthus annuus]|uniref:Uncharacterized protein n=1 Tax=Helianthus annuus TaxID=4232 RepID=A0A9K3P0A4_HELAN|nr:hypothetical protein HanXRQr2_Chr15g0709311 [Helianthus annuus]KAF5765926.1 hypothetical protein HanXRQr2_Chr15g0709321 [Helianthus annuus]KAF5791053.1 hypothetical protein HanXRQr2_Chr09g0390321 [Helianthus annuus]KAF5819272.1 hypothetical protein HanXRQr2_Chr02g0075751 [Helianthus annuus]KAF5819274.1 hypothetical protein HanXRQr2_Chr02g0075771 [Helianthus annuus]